MILFLVIYILGAIGFLIHLFSLAPIERTKAKIIELLLLYQLVFSVGLTSFLAFIGLNFLPETVEAYTEWPSCPYQQELANVNLAYGVLGILAIWFRKSFWTCIVIGFTIWIFGDAIHHFYDAFKYNNFSHGNVGALVYTDIFVPILLCINLYYYLKDRRNLVLD
jgi:hypothetical protein